MKRIEYSSNNSGGSWWLNDEDWYALEKAGWKVEWIKDQKDFDGKYRERWLGALAKRASKEFETPGDAMREFEKLTGQEVSDEGCNCCGAPHSFRWDEEKSSVYVSGERCLEYLYPKQKVPSIREIMEERATKTKTKKSKRKAP